MYIFLIFSIICVIAYMGVMAYMAQGWKATPVWEIPETGACSTRVSILIPARNEEENIVACLSSIQNQNYSEELIQVIVIDDHSEDATPQVVRNFPADNVQLISLAEHVDASQIQSFKKAAIETAMPFASGTLIVTTDADCSMQPDWLRSMVTYYEGNSAKIIAGPVNFHQETNLLEQFQSLDFIGMMGVTASGIHRRFMRMCNGANLAYEKAVFEELDGFSGNEDKASGDDMFLMHKVAEKYPDGVGFVKQPAATVFTTAKPTLREFYRQRLRWATKNAAYDDPLVLVVNAILFFTCFNFFTALIFLPFFPKMLGVIALITLAGKGIADFFFLRMMARFFGRSDLMRIFIPVQFMHTAYIFTVGMAANFIKKYEWKGRKVR